MAVRIYCRASTKDQDAERALESLNNFAKDLNDAKVFHYIENESGTKLNRPVLNQLLDESVAGDVLLVESVDRLSRLTQADFSMLKQRINEKGLRLVVHDLPTTHTPLSDAMTSQIMSVINSMLIDLLATMARLDNDKRIERIKQGLARSGYKPSGKSKDSEKWKLIETLLKSNCYTKAEIAKQANCAVSMVYRVQKEISQIN
ncbi:resolvase [Acinetobacter baumannii]|uniref:recombinase family protein n=1 Tax=Gammaproteobacteria TaxID=1236 RepID=UPI000DE70DD5|nr:MULTISPECIES: recombinase family protein [Gammaproteobacteria]SSI90034.1 resolvase [Acinetobacter baumannii]SSM46526.1 resolvase [Klebsiella pneumoniae]SSO30463.1 resolvase [Acinetobacter baumannii]SSP09054.1 resolvase [Acinetobacter baumannii]